MNTHTLNHAMEKSIYPLFWSNSAPFFMIITYKEKAYERQNKF